MKLYRAFGAALGLGLALAAGPPEAAAKDLIRIAEGPFMSGGGFFIARAKGYFDKLDLAIDTKTFGDGSLAVPSIIAGELDITFLPAAANLFNSVAKGAPLVVILDRALNRPGRGYTVVNVSQAMYDQGVHTMADFAKLKGKRIGVGAVGSINQFNAAKVLLKAGLDPANDVQWIVNVPQPDLMKMLGQNQVEATDLAYQFGFFAQNNKWGPMIANGDEIAPNAQISTYAARKDFLAKNHDAAVRFTVAYLQGIKEFNAAAGDPDKHPDIVEILAKNTALDKPELVKAIAPHWSYIAEDAMPNVASIMEMQEFWSSKYFPYVDKKVSEAQLFDLSIAKEAKERWERDKPFGP
ncbi:MAG TPA: ABC transporter substrate-binding protein [Alphaproteobacteria bacterium]